jgi:hypothetical protein
MSLINERISARNKVSDERMFCAELACWQHRRWTMTARRRLPHRRGAVANGAPASLIGAVVDELHSTERQQDRSAS